MKREGLLICLIMAQAAITGSVHGQTRPADEPFTHLMYRIDNAPVDFEALDGPARRGSDMQATASRFSHVIAPVTPVLHSIAESKTLELLGKAPLIGGPVRLATLSLGAASELSSGFVTLVSLDREQLQPVRDAIQAATRLRRSRSRSEVAAVTASMKGAVAPLNAWVTSGEQQEQRLSSLADGLERLSRLHVTGAGHGTKLLTAADHLRRIMSSVEVRLQSIRRVRSYVEACADDGDAVTSGISDRKAASEPLSVDLPEVTTGHRTGVTPEPHSAARRTSNGRGQHVVSSPEPSQNAHASVGAFAGPAEAAGGSDPTGSSSFPIGAAVFGFAVLLFGGTLTCAVLHRPKPPTVSVAQKEVNASIEVRAPDGSCRHIKMSPERDFLIGRSSACHLQLSDEMTSYRHALLQKAGVQYTLIDLGSTNGVYVNERRVTEETVGDGDIIRVGQTHIQLHLTALNPS